MPRSAARPLRYLDRYVTVSEGEVFYMTELLANLEGLERGPAGNTSLAAAFSIAREMDAEEIIVVQETEYTGAGKHVQAQLSFARSNGIDIFFGDPMEEEAGKNIILPANPGLIRAVDINLDHLRESYIKNALTRIEGKPSEADVLYLVQETGAGADFVRRFL
jgi:hypothetical protein